MTKETLKMKDDDQIHLANIREKLTATVSISLFSHFFLL